LAELAGAEAEPKPARAESKPTPAADERTRPGARAQFEPAHTPAVKISPIIELDKAVPVIVDPLDLVGRTPVVPEAPPAPADRLSESALRTPARQAAATPGLEAVAAETAIEPDSAVELVADTHGEGEHEPEVSERSRITLPPARRPRRARRRLRTLLLAMALLGGLAGVAWHRYPVQSAQGLQRARAELALWSGVLEHQWSLGLRALGR
ncbi:MAG TPA: hypothetical protein VFU02_24170, partial [Polyangiaceae bacterium]|nr:hypothetical protein [Polyangiaceae bacterium]